MQGKKPSDIEIVFVVLMIMLSYVIQFSHCVMPALVLYDMLADARLGVVKDIPSRLFSLAIGGFFFVMVAWYRRTYLWSKGKINGRPGG